jgi:hypothetical protein
MCIWGTPRNHRTDNSRRSGEHKAVIELVIGSRVFVNDRLRRARARWLCDPRSRAASPVVEETLPYSAHGRGGSQSIVLIDPSDADRIDPLPWESARPDVIGEMNSL